LWLSTIEYGENRINSAGINLAFPVAQYGSEAAYFSVDELGASEFVQVFHPNHTTAKICSDKNLSVLLSRAIRINVRRLTFKRLAAFSTVTWGASCRSALCLLNLHPTEHLLNAQQSHVGTSSSGCAFTNLILISSSLIGLPSLPPCSIEASLGCT
jgi:hypothetical protein